ncbi:hypothetical protein AC578_8343 [Pseudocercospora eumusae]|uniref:Uncharacterized protein n=1 Tax=Pseudocercospora eumusae TaxID=321146 RepID=A0A139HS20_9PEZI|nr:hypothetical protein AC578_8343 [Pseudocercospora eumusae]
MPVVLDYDADGNVIGGHPVDELPSRQYMPPNSQAQVNHWEPVDMPPQSDAMQSRAAPAQMVAANSPQIQSSSHLVHDQKNQHKSPSEQAAHAAPPIPGPPQGLLRAPPTGPAASRRHGQPSFEPVGYQQAVPANGINPRRGVKQFHTHRLPVYSKYRSADYGQQSMRTSFLQNVPQQYGPTGHQTPYGPVGNNQHHQAPQYYQQVPVGRGPSYYQHLSQRFDVKQAPRQLQPSQGLGSAFSSPVQAAKNAAVAQIPPPQTVASLALTSQADFDVAGDITVVSEPVCANNIAHNVSNDIATDVPPLDISDSEAESEPLAREPFSVDDIQHTGNKNSTENVTPAVPELLLPATADVAEPTQSSEASSVAPSPQTMGVEDGKVFVKNFSSHFAKDLNALATFETLCKNFNRGALNEVEFVTAMYRLLHRTKATHLMAGFVKFMPTAWKDADLSWLSHAVAHDVEKQQKPAMQQVDVTAQTATKPKKKRPVNAFSTADGPNAPCRKSLTVKLPLSHQDKARALLPPPLGAIEPVPMPFLPAAVVAANEGQNAKTEKVQEDAQTWAKPRVNSGKDDSATAAKNEVPRGRRQSTLPVEQAPEERVGKFPTSKGQAVKTDGTVVDHVGPLFKTRRAVLARDSKPYIHAFCGFRFSHPVDVKTHHRKAKTCVNAAGESKRPEVEWDEHPSCKVDYPQINYTRVAHGYVILDQVSWDKLEGAIQAGLQEVGPYRRYDYPGSEEEEEEKSESDSEGKKRSARIAAAKAISKASRSRKRAASATTAASPPASKKVFVVDESEDVGSHADVDGDVDSQA